MNKKAVIFDMDGVLIDSKDMHFHSWAESGKRYGFTITHDEYARYFGQTSEHFARVMSAEHNIKLSDEEIFAWMAAKDAYFTKAFAGGFQENKPLTSLLEDLQRHDFKMAIGSSAPKDNVRVLVATMPRGELLKNYVTGDDVTKGKPDPEVFLTAAGMVDVPPECCAVIEDSIHGLEAARTAGMTAIGMTGTCERSELEKYAEVVIDSLAEITAAQIEEMIFA